MTSSGEILLRLQGDPSKAVSALKRLSDALGETARKLGQALGGAAVAMRKFGRHFPAPTPEERLFVRRYARAQERSRRNQPPRFDVIPLAEVCSTCGGPGEIADFRGGPDGDWAALECPTCHGIGARPRRGRVGSFSRKRRPHGRR